MKLKLMEAISDISLLAEFNPSHHFL